MPKKLQSFAIFKFDTNRLKEKNYRITISLDEARKNGEIVRLGDSQLLRFIRKIRKIEFSQELLDGLLKEKLKLSRKENNPENKKRIREISNSVDSMLFTDDIVILKISDKRHYASVIKNGLRINGNEYKRILCSAGEARRNSSMFAKVEIWDELNEILNCGIDLNEKINPNKYSSYHALASSASLPVSCPNFVVIPDYEVNRQINVDWFVPKEKGTDPEFEERIVTQKINVFDGEGIISPSQAQIWSEDLGLDYLPSEVIFRAAFSKGLLVVFDIHRFAYENSIREIIDIYGKSHNIDDIEVILTLSQFKGFPFYKSLNDYNEKCKKYDYGWSISRCSPKKDKDVGQVTYQYIQAMNIPNEDVEKICLPTVEWLQNISGLNWKDTIIFLLGELENFDFHNFNSCEVLSKAILLEPDVLKDSHLRKQMFRYINKKIRSSYTGVLNVLGNYSFTVADPYGLMQHAFGLSVTGLLEKDKAYSSYWNKKNIDRVSVFRSPMTWRSEQVVAELSILDKSKEIWYNYINSGIIFNIYSDWPMRLSGSDHDGDLIMTTPSFTDYKYLNLNIPAYDRKIADKLTIDNDKLWISDMLSFGSKIGLITNFSTSFFSMLPMFSGKEKELLINRLKTCSVLQSCSIDKTKGIITYELPDWWDKWNKTGDNAEFYNRMLVRARPYFFRYLYLSWSKRYKHHLASYQNICIVRFGYELDELLKKDNLSEAEQKVKDEFYSRSPLIDSSCTMNLICHEMEKKVKELKLDSKKMDFDYHIYMNPEIEVDENKLNKMSVLFDEYQAHQRNRHDRPSEEIIDDEQVFENPDEFIKVLERKAYNISNNLQELTNLLVTLCYRDHGENSKEFCWRMFESRGIIENLMRRCNGFIQIPLIDTDGDYQYLGKNYKLTNVVLGDSDVQTY